MFYINDYDPKPANESIAIAPVTMMNMERRHGEIKPVIKKAFVELLVQTPYSFLKDYINWIELLKERPLFFVCIVKF